MSQTEGHGLQISGSQEESATHAIAISPNNATASFTVRVAVVLAKDEFKLAFAGVSGRIAERRRLSRGAFAAALGDLPSLCILMEVCGSAHCSQVPQFARRIRPPVSNEAPQSQ